jgi:transcriptional regulator with XRE-family HTH domain
METEEITQSELARALNVEPATVNLWLHKKRLPNDSGIIAKMQDPLHLSDAERDDLMIAWAGDMLIKHSFAYIKAVKTAEKETEFEKLLKAFSD